MITFLVYLLAGLTLLTILTAAVVLITAIAIHTRPDDAPMLSLLTGEPVDNGPPAPVYPIAMARQRRRNKGAA